MVGPPPRQYQEVEVYDEPPLPPQPRRRRRGHGGEVALVASLGLTIFVAAVVIAVQLFGPTRDPGVGAVDEPGPTTGTSLDESRAAHGHGRTAAAHRCRAAGRGAR